MKTFETTRDLKPAESYQPDVIPKGTQLFEYIGCTYGCCSHDETAVTFVANQTPFFGVPTDALKEL